MIETPVIDNPVVTDPFVQSSVLVTFDIMVPVYQSNELRVELVWGDSSFTAGWVVDEYWSASRDLPTETEELLTITFYDVNGEIVLATYSQNFRTGSNPAGAMQITADQFTVDLYDDDDDGVSNLDELIASGDPAVDEDSQLVVVDTFYYMDDSRMTVLQDFDSRLSDERPFMLSTQTSPSTNSSITVDTNIDAEGNGALAHTHLFGSQSIRFSGTRTVSDNAVSWDASRYAFDGDYGHSVVSLKP